MLTFLFPFFLFPAILEVLSAFPLCVSPSCVAEQSVGSIMLLVVKLLCKAPQVHRLNARAGSLHVRSGAASTRPVVSGYIQSVSGTGRGPHLRLPPPPCVTTYLDD